MFTISDRVQKLLGSERSQRKLTIPEGAVRMDKGEPDFATPQHIQDAAYKAMKDGFTHYGNAFGDPELREAICFDLHRDFGVEKTPNDVLVTNGGIEAIHAVTATYLDKGDEAIILDPEYSAYADSVKLFGGTPVFAPLNKDFSLNISAIKERISTKTKMIMFSNPCNPTGKVMNREDVKALADIAVRHNLLIVVDEVYSKLVYDGLDFFSICQIEEIKDRAIMLNSFSKSYAMTGWRIGYIVAESSLIKQMFGFHKALLSCISGPSQKACVAAIRGPQDCVTEMLNEYARRREIVGRFLSEIEGVDPLTSDGAFYFYPRYTHNIKTSDLCSYMYDKGVLIRSGTEFGANGEGHFRIAFAYTPVDQLDSGMAKLKAAFDELKG